MHSHCLSHRAFSTSPRHGPLHLLFSGHLRGTLCPGECTLIPSMVVSNGLGDQKLITVVLGGYRDWFTSAGTHGLGYDLKFVGARHIVLLLLVLRSAVVLQKKLTRLLQHSATLADGTVIQNRKKYYVFKRLTTKK